MTITPFWRWFGFSAAFLLATVTADSQSPPSYEGRTLDGWLQVWEESTGGRSVVQEKAAEEAIRRMNGEAAIYLANLVERWDPRLDNNGFFRAVNQAFAVLGDEGKEGVPILLRTLRRFGENLPESSERFRFALVNLSWIATGPEAVAALLRVPLVKGGEHEIHYLELALSRILRKGNHQSRTVVQESLDAPLPVRALAALSLARTGEFSPKVSEVLSEALSHGGPVLIDHVLASTSTMDDPSLNELVEPLFRLLSSEHDVTSTLAAKTLGRTGAKGLPAILRACRGETLTTKRSGAQALAIHCQRLNLATGKVAVVEEIQPVLLELLQLDDRKVVLMALAAVIELGGQAEGLRASVSALENAEDQLIAEKAQRAMRAILEGEREAEPGAPPNGSPSPPPNRPC